MTTEEIIRVLSHDEEWGYLSIYEFDTVAEWINLARTIKYSEGYYTTEKHLLIERIRVMLVLAKMLTDNEFMELMNA